MSDLEMPLRRRLVPVLGLMVLAPFVGEFLLGNVSIVELPALVMLAPMYGGGAVLIRELARRTGRGWPTMLVLGLAYGLIEPGVFDGSLFNPDFQHLGLQAHTAIPWLGIGAADTVSFVVGHAVWSICVPIAVVETLATRQRTTPWLGRVGVGVIAVVYVAGGLFVLRWSVGSQGFTASPAQLAGVLAVAAALVAAAFAVRPRPARSARRAPRPWLLALAALVIGGAFHLFLPQTWTGVGVGLGLVALSALAVGTWSRRAGWGQPQRFALAAAGLLVCAAGGFLLSIALGRDAVAPYVGNVLFAAVAAALCVAGWVAARRPREG